MGGGNGSHKVLQGPTLHLLSAGDATEIVCAATAYMRITSTDEETVCQSYSWL